jgi:hypothetical protein
MNKCVRKISNTLSKQLYLGSMKIYKDLHSFKNYDNNNKNTDENSVDFFLKISGVWETENEIGLTYKLHKT